MSIPKRVLSIGIRAVSRHHSRSMTASPPLLKVLHVGVANRGRWPLVHATPAAGFAPHALCDPDPAALAAARELTGLPEEACFPSLDEALARSGADCAIICAPTRHHVPMTIRAVEAGLAVLVEKGMAPDWASAQALAAHVRARNAKVAVAQNYRYNPVEQAIRRALRDPASPVGPGRVHQVSYSQQRVRPHPRTLDYPFASVWDMSCHHFDNLLDWLGPMHSMTAHSWRAEWSAYTHDANTAAQIVFASGARVHYLHTHDAARATLDIELHGERGALFFRDDVLSFSERPCEQFGSRPTVTVEPGADHGLADLLRDFHAYATGGPEPGISVRHNLETMAACELMARSIREGRTVLREELDQS